MECGQCSADGGMLVGVVSGKYCGDIMRMVLQAGVEDSTLRTDITLRDYLWWGGVTRKEEQAQGGKQSMRREYEQGREKEAWRDANCAMFHADSKTSRPLRLTTVTCVCSSAYPHVCFVHA